MQYILAIAVKEKAPYYISDLSAFHKGFRRFLMKQTNTTQGLVNILEVLDMLIEILDNSSRAYQRMALEAQPNGARAMLNWFYYIETIRLRRLCDRRRSLLRRHPELEKSKIYTPRAASGLNKMGSGNGLMRKAEPLDVLRFAIENEARGMAFFRRKAASAVDATQRLMLSAAIKEQENQITLLTAKRQELMQRQIDKGAESLDWVLA